MDIWMTIDLIVARGGLVTVAGELRGPRSTNVIKRRSNEKLNVTWKDLLHRRGGCRLRMRPPQSLRRAA